MAPGFHPLCTRNHGKPARITHHLHERSTQCRQGLSAGLTGLGAQGVYVIHCIAG